MKTPGGLQQSLQRFLQFHDQHTAGVPGHSPLYDGVHARVTDELVENKNIVMLKHFLCTVIGWELHPADAASAPGAERSLNHMPRCLYLEFVDATWAVDARLGQAVWPLHRSFGFGSPTTHKEQMPHARASPFLPDYAFTAFMIQGATLQAAIAVCGDVADAGGLWELMTTYVILSRVKSADGLLPLRAFCPNLFQMGAPLDLIVYSNACAICLRTPLKLQLTSQQMPSHNTKLLWRSTRQGASQRNNLDPIGAAANTT